MENIDMKSIKIDKIFRSILRESVSGEKMIDSFVLEYAESAFYRNPKDAAKAISDYLKQKYNV